MATNKNNRKKNKFNRAIEELKEIISEVNNQGI